MAIAVAPHIARMPRHFTVMRGFQLFFALLTLGLSAYSLAWAPFPGAIICLVCAICTIIGTIYVIIATHNRPRIYNNWAVLFLEIFLFLFWTIASSFISLEVTYRTVSTSGSSYYDRRASDALTTYLGLMAGITLAASVNSLLYFISLIIFSVMLSRHRSDRRRIGGPRKYAGPDDALVGDTVHLNSTPTAYDPHLPAGQHTSENSHMLPQAATYADIPPVPNSYVQHPGYAHVPQ